jgi:hypothetical protein
VLEVSTATRTEIGGAGLVWSKPILKANRPQGGAVSKPVTPFRQEQDHVVVGSRPVMGQKDRLPCGVVATSTTQWLWIADTLGLDPEWCFLGKDVADADWLRSAYPKTAFLRDPRWIRPVAVVFCDGRPPPFVYEIDGVVLLFHCKAPRRYTQASWKTHVVRFRQSDPAG